MTIEDEMFELSSFNRRYLKWIVAMLGGEHHVLLFKQLHDIIFRWDPDVPMDENHEHDGRNVRELFQDETGYPIPQVAQDWPASFLEVLVSLSVTMEKQIMHAPGNGDGTAAWFWMLLTNINLANCDDEWMKENRHNGEFYISSRVNDVMFRHYGPDGKGGLFPLDEPRADQRKVELWYQMNAYVLEKNWV